MVVKISIDTEKENIIIFSVRKITSSHKKPRDCRDFR